MFINLITDALALLLPHTRNRRNAQITFCTSVKKSYKNSAGGLFIQKRIPAVSTVN